ncbi:MAG TPA: methionine synthase [Firmicutes bacterium]|jgi:methanogenic corrinoid protein MtbC1|nr:methionine synthase [Bacillota bacterium]
MEKKFIDAIVAMEDEKAVEIARQLLGEGIDANRILGNCQTAMEKVGKLFEKGEYFLPELIMSGEILKGITEVIKPGLELGEASDKGEKAGKVVFGTVFGDIHDIGKDIVIFMLETNNFEVVDLGVDVPIARFVEAIREEKPDIVGMSGFLTKTFDAMKVTIAGIEEAGLRKSVKIMIGGGTVTDDVVAYAGADAYGESALDAVNLAKSWTGGK